MDHQTNVATAKRRTREEIRQMSGTTLSLFTTFLTALPETFSLRIVSAWTVLTILLVTICAEYLRCPPYSSNA